MTNYEKHMRTAIACAMRNPKAPFGAILVDREADVLVAEGVNRTRANPLLHGEIDVINRYASSKADCRWATLDLYTTAEPCPMCQPAILWAGIGRVIFGTSISKLKQLGWNQIDLAAEELVLRTPFAECDIRGGVLESECDRLFADALSP